MNPVTTCYLMFSSFAFVGTNVAFVENGRSETSFYIAKNRLEAKMIWFALFFAASSILSYGMAFAHFQFITQERFTKRNRVTAAMVSVLGPCSLLIAVGCTKFARQGIRFI